MKIIKARSICSSPIRWLRPRLPDHDVPDDLSYLLSALGHEVVLLRSMLPRDSSDPDVLRLPNSENAILITCNRDDFLTLARTYQQQGLIVLIRRKSRAAERAALLKLLNRAGPSGLDGNVNLA